MKDKKKERIIVIISVIVIVCVGGLIGKMLGKNEPEKPVVTPLPQEATGNFDIDIIRNANVKDNYLISPYNIKIALSMLRDGADGNTKDELDKVLGDTEINDVSVKDKLKVANGLFVKNKYKNDVKSDFTNTLKTNYNAEILYDEYNTPAVINNWAEEKTNGMIKNLLNEMPNNFVLGIASALALDVKWQNEFECIGTTSEEFTKIDNGKMNTEMMHQTYKSNLQYFNNQDAEGVIIPYKVEENSNVELEFVGILPKTSVDDYVSNLTMAKIDSIFMSNREASKELHVNLSLPRFTYDYSVDNFKDILINMGIKDAFDQENANFKKMIDEQVYVSSALHKTKIELSESGTKAAAVTYFGVETSGYIAPEEFEEINIKFNKPFVYIIREKNTREILFFGAVYEPNKWSKTTCEE